MRKPSIGITPEGVPSIFLTSISALIFALLNLWPLAVICLLLVAFSLHFFRDPERVVPTRPHIGISPADGKVVRIANLPDPFTGEPKQCISIFMNVFSVHVNRMPVSGKISAISYRPGRFLNANLNKASTENERCAYTITDEDKEAWHMVQIAGLIARRIVCRVDEGDQLARGERYGMIKFGSRVDVFIPDSYTPSVMIGDIVFSGQTVIAHKTES